MCKVLNKRDYKSLTPNDVYVGRPTKWGNPFSYLDNTIAKYKVKDRDEAVNSYENYLLNNKELMNSLKELKGKNLICWCAPLSCHADVLIKYANKT